MQCLSECIEYFGELWMGGVLDHLTFALNSVSSLLGDQVTLLQYHLAFWDVADSQEVICEM